MCRLSDSYAQEVVTVPSTIWLMLRLLAGQSILNCLTHSALPHHSRNPSRKSTNMSSNLSSKAGVAAYTEGAGQTHHPPHWLSGGKLAKADVEREKARMASLPP
jgi:hypothetical protein